MGDLAIFNEIILDLPQLGKLRGSTTTGAWTGREINQFLNVKYAEAPVGNLRFRKPKPVAPWTGIRDATQYGRRFPNPTDFEAIPEEEKFSETWEDCLSLCVYTTNFQASRPVMVYIHGGSFTEGGSPHHPPNYLLEKDVVLVVPQYRLGPLGFLCLMTDAMPGNAAIFDVMLALEWVQQNIKQFGGDPNNVTLFGQSAGAAIVSILCLSSIVPENLFHRIILQSGAAFGNWCFKEDGVKNEARKVAINSGKCNASSTDEDITSCLLEMDIKTLFRCCKGIGTKPVIGGPTGLLTESPHKIFLATGGRKNLAMMAGITKHECGYVLIGFYDYIEATKGFKDTKFNSFHLIQSILDRMKISDVTGAFAAYISMVLFKQETLVKGNFEEMLNGLFDMFNTIHIKGPILKHAQLNSLNSNRTWLYSFDYEGEHTRHGYGADTSKYPFNGGVAHSNDNLYLFPWPEDKSKLNEKDTKMAQKMVDIWTSFAINGTPSCPGIERWPTMETPIGPYLHIDKTSTVAQNFYDEFTIVSRAEKLRNTANNLREPKEMPLYEKSLL
ncbi:hypothetical protein DMENIID0001_128520 [Sergentomyia squamirostris]